jgi:hypothetical protein
MKWFAVASKLTYGLGAARDKNPPGVRRASSEPSRLDVVTPLDIVVSALPEIPRAIVKGALEEASAIWDPASLAFRWHVVDALNEPADPFSVRVILNDEVGTAYYTQRALGWITFGASGAPGPVIHLSHGNAVWLLDAIGTCRSRPTREREMLLGRALGRALAHELGHYLLPLKNHTPAGLMRGRRSRDEFFAPRRTGFEPNSQERGILAVRVGLQEAE